MAKLDLFETDRGPLHGYLGPTKASLSPSETEFGPLKPCTGHSRIDFCTVKADLGPSDSNFMVFYGEDLDFSKADLCP